MVAGFLMIHAIPLLTSASIGARKQKWPCKRSSLGWPFPGVSFMHESSDTVKPTNIMGSSPGITGLNLGSGKQLSDLLSTIPWRGIGA